MGEDEGPRRQRHRRHEGEAVRIIECEQRTPEWFAARLGRLTASRAADMLATIKTGEAAARRNLRTQLVLERLTGVSQESPYQSDAMRQGIEREADALLWYEAQTGQIVQRSGFVAHDDLMAGASLDGHVGDFAGIVEAKCPLASTHLETLESGAIPSDYQKQIVHQLWISGARWCDYVSYHPDFPEPLRLRIVRMMRDDGRIAEYETSARVFLSEVDGRLAALTMLPAWLEASNAHA